MTAPDPSRPTYGDWIAAERTRMLADAEARDAAELAPEPAPKGWWVAPAALCGILVWAVILLPFLAAIVTGAAALIRRML
jgi:hypothetical protein